MLVLSLMTGKNRAPFCLVPPGVLGVRGVQGTLGICFPGVVSTIDEGGAGGVSCTSRCGRGNIIVGVHRGNRIYQLENSSY